MRHHLMIHKFFLAISLAAWVPSDAHGDFNNKIPQLPKPAPKKKAEDRPLRSTDEALPVPAPSSNSNTSNSAPQPGLFSEDVTKHNTDSPVSFKADNMKGVKGKVTELIGNVYILQDNTALRSKKATIFPDPVTNRPVKAIAVGNVKVDKKPSPEVPEIHAVAEQIEYFFDTKSAILTGRPKIWRGDEVLTGQIMEMNLVTGEVQIRGVRGVVDPENTNTDTKSKATPKKSEKKR